MAAPSVQAAFHVPVFLAFFFSTYYDWFYVAINVGPFKKLYFLTFWNAVSITRSKFNLDIGLGSGRNELESNINSNCGSRS